MKVVYTSIEQLVEEAIRRADRDGMKIRRIELTPHEFTDLTGKHLRSGIATYMGTLIVRVPE